MDKEFNSYLNNINSTCVMDKLNRFFWFAKDNTSSHLSDAILAVMGSDNGSKYMKTRNQNKKFCIKSNVVQEIIQRMNFNHSKTYNIFLLEFVENVYKRGYSVSKLEYIRKFRPDIMKAIQTIERHWIKYIYKKNELEFSMDFEDLVLT